MIIPTIRASFDRKDARHLVQLLGRDDPELGERARVRLEEEGVDSLLDDPRVRNALLTDPRAGASPAVVFYVLVRQALLESGIDDRRTADYVASLVLDFGRGDRAYRISEETDEEFHYLVDIVTRMGDVRDRKAFLLRAHLGNYSLWISGLFPDYLEARVQRKGAPPISYYENLGSTGFRMAADSPQAESLGVEEVLREVGREFSGVRTALNRVSDRYLWPGGGNPVNRLLREVADRVDLQEDS